MSDITFIHEINGYSVQVEFVDYGERLQDYEGFWKWFLLIRDAKNEQLYKQNGPENGYYGTAEEAMAEALEQIEAYHEFEIEEDAFIERLKNDWLKRFKRSINNYSEIKYDKINETTIRKVWNT